MNLTIQHIHDEINYLIVMVIVGILFVITPYLMGIMAQVNMENHYVQVDQDIWSFLKYVGVVFMGLLVWIGKEMIGSFKMLTKTIDDLNVTVRVNNEDVKHIKEDVSEIKESIVRHDARINTLEKNQKN